MGNCVDVCQHGDGGVAAGWMQPPGEKMSGITAFFSTRLTPETDGAIAGTTVRTMATAFMQQQEARQANQREGCIAI